MKRAIVFASVFTIALVAYVWAWDYDGDCRHEQENTTLRHTLTTTQDSLRRTRDSLDRQNAALDTILSRKNDQRLRGLLNAVMAVREWERVDSAERGGR